VDQSLAQVDLIPAEFYQLTDPQAVPVADQDQRRIPVPVAATSAGGGHQSGHLIWC
jgi:hypothetical protein